MLPRILLVLDDRALRRQLRATLAQPDIIVHALRSAQRLWERAPRGTSDLIVIGRSLMAEPPEEMVRVLRELPELPAIVVLWDGCTPEQEASLLAAGCQQEDMTARTEGHTDHVGARWPPLLLASGRLGSGQACHAQAGAAQGDHRDRLDRLIGRHR